MKKTLNVLFLLLTPTIHAFANGNDIADESTCTTSSSQNDYVSAPSLVPIEGFLISGELCKHIVSFLPKNEQLMALHTVTPLIPADANDKGEIDLSNRLSGIFNLNEKSTAYFDSATRQFLIDPDHELVPLYNIKSLKFMIRPTPDEMILLSQKFPNVENIDLSYVLKLNDMDNNECNYTDIIKNLTHFKNLQNLETTDDIISMANSLNLQHIRIINTDSFENPFFCLDSWMREFLQKQQQELEYRLDVYKIIFSVAPTPEEIILLSQKFPNVKTIYLNGALYSMPIAEKINIIKELNNFKKLRSLAIAFNRIDNEVATHIAQLRHLQRLFINHNLIANEGAIQIAKMQNLTYLEISHGQIGDEGIASLKTGLPFCNIKDLYIK
ncbi:MAG: hypothetical protein Q8S31_02645 [Alphaproteobacteria bacterium]|nr:hypothetical protein [Alphaproteobacteria bacterium]